MTAELIKEFKLFDSDILNYENQTKEDLLENIGCFVDWKSMCQFSKLKEDFLRKHLKKIDFKYISSNINIIFSEDFVFEFKDKLDVTAIILRKKNGFNGSVEYVQQFSIDFIESIQKYINWGKISGQYDLTENFIDKFIDNLNLIIVVSRINLSDEFIKKHESKLGKIQLSEKEKIRQILNHGYTIIGKNKEKWVECYKAVRNNYSSIYAGDEYIYDKVDYTYETECDYCVLTENSFGFGCWTKEKAILFGLQIYGSRLIKVVVPVKNLCILPNGKIRSSKMIITDLCVIRNIESLRYK